MIACLISFFLMKAVMTVKKHHADDLEFNPDADQSQVELLDDN